MFVINLNFTAECLWIYLMIECISLPIYHLPAAGQSALALVWPNDRQYNHMEQHVLAACFYGPC